MITTGSARTANPARLALLAIALAFLNINLAACAILQPVRDPLMQLLRRGACISVDIPPITLTPERTAAERQLIGTEGEIEKEGWLIASAQSAGGQASAKSNGNAPLHIDETQRASRRYYIEAGVIDFYNPIVLKYRRQELLGESYDGLLRAVPPGVSQARYFEDRDMAAEVATEVNRARLWIYEYERANANGQAAGAQATRDRYLLRWYNEAKGRSGEWIYTEQKKWVRAR